ncbi:hypothetical protein STEG23_019469, partial [Scotinomys teguina]
SCCDRQAVKVSGVQQRVLLFPSIMGPVCGLQRGLGHTERSCLTMLDISREPQLHSKHVITKVKNGPPTSAGISSYGVPESIIRTLAYWTPRKLLQTMDPANGSCNPTPGLKPSF